VISVVTTGFPVGPCGLAEFRMDAGVKQKTALRAFAGNDEILRCPEAGNLSWWDKLPLYQIAYLKHFFM
jgi:hypothetical protein